MLTSILIPSRNEPYLGQTINDLLAKATGEIEVVAVLDGYWPEPIIGDPRVRYIHRGKPHGMRAAINAAAALATGEFLLKTDAHCMFAEGFDEVLAADCAEDWVVVPRRKRLNPETWTVIDDGRPDIDYMYLAFEDGDLHGRLWEEKNRDPALKDVLIDDLMSSQGSCWFMRRDYFSALELMDETAYGTFAQEFQEIAMKCWLSGGRCVVNKNTSYAHWHKPSRGYSLDNTDREIGRAQTRKWLAGDAWSKASKPLSWLVEKFWPVPSWPDDRALWAPQGG